MAIFVQTVHLGFKKKKTGLALFLLYELRLKVLLYDQHSFAMLLGMCC